VLFDKLDTTKMHGLDTSNVSCRVVSRRDVTRQVEFGLIVIVLPTSHLKRMNAAWCRGIACYTEIDSITSIQ